MANIAPVVKLNIPFITANEHDATFSYTIPAGTFFDANGDTLTYSATL